MKNVDGTTTTCASSSIVKLTPSPTVKLSPKLNETLSPEKVWFEFIVLFFSKVKNWEFKLFDVTVSDVVKLPDTLKSFNLSPIPSYNVLSVSRTCNICWKVSDIF